MSDKFELITDVAQGTAEWHALRRGNATASRYKDVMSKGRAKGTVGKAYNSYLLELAAEQLTGQSDDDLSHMKAIQWGNENEPEARSAYMFTTGFNVKEVTYAKSKLIDNVGGSPDGVCFDGDRIVGGVEFKCPYKTATHIRYIQESKLPDEYYWQVHGCMWLCDTPWWDFVSYDPRMPKGSRVFMVRVERDEKTMIDLETRLRAFSADLSALLREVERNAK